MPESDKHTYWLCSVAQIYIYIYRGRERESRTLWPPLKYPNQAPNQSFGHPRLRDEDIRVLSFGLPDLGIFVVDIFFVAVIDKGKTGCNVQGSPVFFVDPIQTGDFLEHVYRPIRRAHFLLVGRGPADYPRSKVLHQFRMLS